MKTLISTLIIILLFSCSSNDADNDHKSNFEIGNTSPNGGLIFYDKGVYSNGWRYLEVTPEDLGKEIEWGCYNQYISLADKTGIGEGDINTESISNQCNEEIIAARLCQDLNYGNSTDWYLPSIDELKLIYNNLYLNDLGNFYRGVGDFSDLTYWSSSQSKCPNNPNCGDHDAWIKLFETGQEYNTFSKSNKYRVRAVRKI